MASAEPAIPVLIPSAVNATSAGLPGNVLNVAVE